MSRFTRLLLLALAAGMALALLTACGGGRDDEPDVQVPRIDCARLPAECL